MDEISLIEEAISEEKQYIAEGTDLLSRTTIETEDTQNKNVIHPYFQVPAVEHKYNSRHPWPDYTNRCGFQATIINCAPTKLSTKRGLKKFKQKGECGNCRTRIASWEGRIPASENRELNRKTEARFARPANIPKIKSNMCQ